MTPQRPQLQLSLVWADSDIHEVVVHVRSEHFSGATSLYVVPGELADVAGRLSGFPASREDRRTFTLGQADLPGYGQVQATLECRDSIGHVNVYVEVQSAPTEPKDKPEACAVQVRVVPSDIDRFVEGLRDLNAEGRTATLQNAA